MDQSASVTAASTFSHDKQNDNLPGHLVIKAQLGNDIRKMMIFREDLTLNELILMMQRIFAGKISHSDELTLKYFDNDGDLITLTNDGDLTLALRFCRQLRLSISIKGAEPSSKVNETSSTNIKAMHNELIQIRNLVQHILDRFPLETNDTSEKQEEKSVSSPPVAAHTPSQESNPVPSQQQARRSYLPNGVRSRLYHISRKSLDGQDTSMIPPNHNSMFSPVPAQPSESGPSAPQTNGPPLIPRSFPSAFANANFSASLPSTPVISSPMQNPTASFIGQQPQSISPTGSTQSLYQQKAAPSALGAKYSRSAFQRQQSATPPTTPPISIFNPLSVQAPPPPPLASQVPYGGQQTSGTFYNANSSNQ